MARRTQYPRIWIAAHGGPRNAVDAEDAPPEVLRVLALEKKWIVRALTAFHPNTPQDVLRYLGNDRSQQVLEHLVSNLNTPADVLRNLAGAEGARYDDLRQYIAEHENTPPDVLAVLADDPSGPVRTAVARNPNTPLETHKKLAAKYANVNTGQFAKWWVKAAHPDYWVRKGIISGNMPVEVVRHLTKDKTKTVRDAAFEELKIRRLEA